MVALNTIYISGVKDMIKNESNIDFSKKINFEVNPFLYLGEVIPSNIIFGKEIRFYKITEIPRSASRRKMIRDYEDGLCFLTYDNLIYCKSFEN
jgi:hypothetical protein